MCITNFSCVKKMYEIKMKQKIFKSYLDFQLKCLEKTLYKCYFKIKFDSMNNKLKMIIKMS